MHDRVWYRGRGCPPPPRTMGIFTVTGEKERRHQTSSLQAGA